MRGFLTISVVFLIGLSLAGCVNHSNDYLRKGGQISPLVVPRDVPVLKQSSYYPIPKAHGVSATDSVSLKPPTL